MNTIIIIIITTAVFIPIYIIWNNILDKIDNYLRNKLTDEQYIILNILIFTITLLILSAIIIKTSFR